MATPDAAIVAFESVAEPTFVTWGSVAWFTSTPKPILPNALIELESTRSAFVLLENGGYILLESA